MVCVGVWCGSVDVYVDMYICGMVVLVCVWYGCGGVCVWDGCVGVCVVWLCWCVCGMVGVCVWYGCVGVCVVWLWWCVVWLCWCVCGMVVLVCVCCMVVLACMWYGCVDVEVAPVGCTVARLRGSMQCVLLTCCQDMPTAQIHQHI